MQRFSSALSLNIHLHMPLCLDGVYVPRSVGGLRFRQVKSARREELEHLVQQIAERVGRSAGADGAVAARCPECVARAAVRRGSGCDTPAPRQLGDLPHRGGA
ncbi:MAG: transposase [Gammaproteobacteria bacterium]|nr:transposase [Gammaproteobacteria bacterium]